MTKSVLIVDDNADIRSMLRLALERDFTVTEADNALTAWSMIKISPPDAMVLDVMMPGLLNGLQLCDQIRQDPGLQGLVIVVATACGQPADRAYAMALGADAYYVKPFSPLALHAELRQLMQEVRS